MAPTRIKGVGSACQLANQELVVTVKFVDRKPHTLVAMIVDDVPHDVIIGFDFMRRERIGFCPTDSGFELFNSNTRERQVIFSSDMTEEEFKTQRDARVHDACTVQTAKKLGRKGCRKYVQKWNRLPESDKNLIATLASVKLNPLPEEELHERLNHIAKKVEHEVNVNSTDSGRLCAIFHCFRIGWKMSSTNTRTCFPARTPTLAAR